MPIYEYRCLTCSYQFELLRSFTDTEEVICPQCSSSTERLLSAGTGFIIKGGGSSLNTGSRRNREGCDRDSPCCGAETPCDKPPCND